jgi:hypothetical protein
VSAIGLTGHMPTLSRRTSLARHDRIDSRLVGIPGIGAMPAFYYARRVHDHLEVRVAVRCRSGSRASGARDSLSHARRSSGRSGRQSRRTGRNSTRSTVSSSWLSDGSDPRRRSQMHRRRLVCRGFQQELGFAGNGPLATFTVLECIRLERCVLYGDCKELAL